MTQEQSTAIATTEHRPTGLIDLGQFKTAADVFIKSGYFDSALGKTSPEVMVARAQVKLAAGAELGLPPMLSLQGIHWIQPDGQAGRLMKGAAVCAFVLGRSKKYRFTTIERSEKQAVIEFEELRDGKWTKVFTSTFTQQMAGALLNKAVYKNFMSAMLWNRAMTNGANTVAADEINGSAGEPEDAEYEVIDDNGNGHGNGHDKALIPEDEQAPAPSAAVAEPKVAADVAAPVEKAPATVAATKGEPAADAPAAEKPAAKPRARKLTPAAPAAAQPEVKGPASDAAPAPAADVDFAAVDEVITDAQFGQAQGWLITEKFDISAAVKRHGFGAPSLRALTQAQFALIKQDRDDYIKGAANDLGWNLTADLTLSADQVKQLQDRAVKAARK